MDRISYSSIRRAGFLYHDSVYRRRCPESIAGSRFCVTVRRCLRRQQTLQLKMNSGSGHQGEETEVK